MTKQYQDNEGVIVTAYPIIGPTVLNTINGEMVAIEGQYCVILQDNRLVVIDSEQFLISFTEVK